MDTIRIIHNLPRTGGTIISKSVSAQKNIILLSEIHPEGIEIRKHMGVQPDWGDPLYQFQNWYNPFKVEEYDKIKSSNIDFLSKIKLINNKVKNENKKLIIRDWSFIDFLGKPYVEPKEKNSLYEILSNDFEIKNIYLLRDPIEMFISCNTKLSFFTKNYTFDLFLKGYNAYLDNIKGNRFIKFENFIHNTTENLIKISEILDFEYDEDYYKNLENTKITGDVGATKSTAIGIKKNMFDLLNEDQKKQINNNKNYLEVKSKLDKLY